MTSTNTFPDSDISTSQSANAETEPDMSLDQFLDGVVEVTIAVLRQQPEKKSDWWNTLNKFYSQAWRHREKDRMAFFDALRQLVEGASPERLSPSIPETFQRYWQAILDGITA